ncbi:MAG TPA: hypothetical protein DCY31_08775 [Ruminococcaceae bacterium]|nr:hypothetical protein [Oscillospiraceae bacterium]
MKIISLIALGLACALSGRYIAVRLSRRVKILEKIILMFGTIETEIGYLSRPTEELIKRLADKDELSELDFLPACLSLCENGESINEAWGNALSRSDKVTGEDSCILYSFGENLGRSDVDGQLANCRYHLELAQERLREARENRERYASLACGLGMLSGIGIFIIFF